MTPQTTNPLPLKPTPVSAPSLTQIGVDLEALAKTRNQARYDQLLAASKTTVNPRQATAFDSRSVPAQIINSRPAVYMTVSENNKDPAS